MNRTEEEKAERTYVRRNFRRDPIYGYIYLHDYEDRIVRTPLFLRLKGITQAHSAFPFYPGATHNRYQHSLGVAHVAGEFASFILEDEVKFGGIDESYRNTLVRLSRIWGLIHDIGHGPFSHAFDDHVLQMSDYRVGSKRITHHDTLGLYLAKFNKGMKAALNYAESKLQVKRDLLLDVFRMNALEECVSKSDDYEHMILENIFWGKYGADFIDYLQRDALYAGTPEYGTLDWKRLVMTSHFYHGRMGARESKMFCLEDRSQYTLYSFVNSFFQMYQAVYFNKNVRILDHLIGRFLEAVEETGLFDEFLRVETEEGAERFELLDEKLLLGIFSLPYANLDVWGRRIAPEKFQKAHELCLRVLNVDTRCDSVVERVYTPTEKSPDIFGRLNIEYANAIMQLQGMTKKILFYIERIFEPIGFAELTESQKAECFIDTPRFERERCPLYKTSFFGFLDRYGNFRVFKEAEHPFLEQLPKYIDIIRLYLNNRTITALSEIQEQYRLDLEGDAIVFSARSKEKTHREPPRTELSHRFSDKLKGPTQIASLSWIQIVKAVLEEVLEYYPRETILKRDKEVQN